MPEKIYPLEFALIATLVPISLLVIIIIIFIVFSKRKNSLIAEKQKASLQFLTEITKTKIEIKDETLKEVGRELHDNIGQLLLVSRMQVQDLMQEINHPKLKLINETTSKSMDELRLLSKLINTDIIKDFGLIESLYNQKKLFEKAGNYKLVINETGTPFKIENNHELILFRICQETISNSIKYANTEEVIINLDYENPKLIIAITDFGTGFNNEEIIKGNGITNMKNRAILINAIFSIHSEKDKGTITTINYTSHE